MLVAVFMILFVVGIIYTVIAIRKHTPDVPTPAGEKLIASLEIPRPSTVEGDFYRSWCPDDVKFFPPTEIVSKLPGSIFIPGAEIILKREPSNEYDSGAIALYLSGHKIGYMLRNGLQEMVHEWNEKGWPVGCNLVSLKKSRGEYQGYVALAFYRPKDSLPEGARRLGYGEIDIKSIKPTNPDAIPNTQITGKNIVFSGYFEKPIPEMMQLAVDAGATLKSRVSKSVNYLVVGHQGPGFTNEDGLSGKEVTATKLNAEGAKIEIISEEVFLYLVSHPLE